MFNFSESPYVGTRIQFLTGPLNHEQVLTVTHKDIIRTENGAFNVGLKDATYVDFEAVRKLAIRHKIPTNSKVFASLILRLNRCAERWHWSEIGVSTSDKVLARKIEDSTKFKSVGIVAKVCLEMHALKEVSDNAGAVLNEKYSRLIESDPTEYKVLENMRCIGFDAQKVGEYYSLNGSKFIQDWFMNAKIVFEALSEAKQRLSVRNWGKDKTIAAVNELRKSNQLPPLAEFTREAVLFGRDLPALFERITGQQFISRKDELGEVIELNCHHFVSSASMAIGLSNPVARTIHDHWKQMKGTV